MARGFRGNCFLSALATAMCLFASSSASAAAFFEPFNVSYDHRAIRIAGDRRMLISGGIHYPRATPDMWPSIIAKSKEGGADVIQSYVFWNGHEPIRGQYYFEGRYDLVKFVKLIGSHGLYLHLRIGPYVCAEWNFGGLPVWLRDIPGIEFRTNNGPFKDEMHKFVKKIVDLMKQEMLFSWQGGPIILLQIENEYGNIETQYGQGGKEYVKWAAEMALGLGAGVPWVMCRQNDAPETIIDACNGFYCDGFRPNSYHKPALWTEDWNGWFAFWGGRIPHRPVEDNAFAIARFFQRGGSFHNYYMYFGGTNFGRTAGGPLQITSYDYDAPIDEYGLLNQPKWGHLKDLHSAIKLCEPALTAVDGAPEYIKLGPMQEAHIYSSRPVNTSRSFQENVSTCSAFLANIDEHKTVSVTIFGKSYSLLPWSVSILPDCKNVAFNTAKVGAQISIRSFESDFPNDLNISGPLDPSSPRHFMSNWWKMLKEPISLWDGNNFTAQGLLEHLNVTKDNSDYLWYNTRIYVSGDDITYWEEQSVVPSLKINKTRDFVQFFVNGQLSGSKVGKWISVDQPIQFVQGFNDLVLLTETIGLQNYGAFLEKDGAGFRGEMKLTGFKDGDIDLSNAFWTYQVGLKGESKKVYTPENQENADWVDLQSPSVSSSFTWYKTIFDAPKGSEPVALYLGSMGKGQAWVNGYSIGRYWSIVAPKQGCDRYCNYRGAYNENKCMTNCGERTQSLYHVPREWLQPSDNLLVIFEETGGDPLTIKLTTRYTRTVCGQVSETHNPPLSAWADGNMPTYNFAPVVNLQCDDGHVISSVTFASFGTPRGSCEAFSQGWCHASSSLSIVTEACQGRNNCTLAVSRMIFGDPCRGTVKSLAIQAECTPLLEPEMLHASQ